MSFARRLILGLASGALCATAAAAQEEENPAVAARQAQMTLQGFNLGILGQMAKGEAEYDAERADAAAANLAALTGTDWSAYFPEGTADGEVPDTAALPAIWENMADFDAKKQKVAEAAEAMAAAAGSGLDALKGAMSGLGNACTACHEEYRKED